MTDQEKILYGALLLWAAFVGATTVALFTYVKTP